MSNLALPHTLVAGTPENINDVQANFDAIETWANGGNIGSANLSASAVGPAQLAVLPACRVGMSANQSIPNNTATQLTFQTEAYDTDNIHSTVSNQGRLTVATAGIYSVFAYVAFVSNATGYRQVTIQYNGVTGVAAGTAPAVNGAPTVFAVSGEYQMAAGDYFNVMATQNSGGAINVDNISVAFGCCFRTRAS